MSHPSGTIQSISSSASGPQAQVLVDVREACPRCAAGKGCGAGLLGGQQRTRTVQARIGAGLQLCVGDTVELRLAPANLLLAAAIVYGLPLLGAIAAAGLAYLLQFGDAAAAGAAVLGLIAGGLVGRARLGRAECMGELTPTIEKKLHNGVD